jgi:hypothetical protein
MERSSEYHDLAAALAELRPAPEAGFGADLDRRVAAGFPRRSRLGGGPLGALGDRLRGIAPRRLLFAGSGAVLAAIAVATVIVAGSNPGRPAPSERFAGERDSGGLLDQVNRFSRQVAPQLEAAESGGAGAAGGEYSVAESGANAGFARLARHRDIERSAEIGLLADPSDVTADSAKVFSAVHDAHGIVLHSTTTAGKRAGAYFDLLIPSARLGDALAAFSAIDEVRTRHEATTDITAPTVTAEEELRDSQARVDSLLAQLSSTEVESERETIEAELHTERRQAAQLRIELAHLHRHTSFSRVSLRIESGASGSAGGSWGIDDAFHDAGHVLSIAAGVTLVGLAVLAPVALIFLLAWLARRAWVRAQRRQALRDA